MCYSLQLAKEKLESDKIIFKNENEYNLKNTEIKSINDTNTKTLKRNNEEIEQCNSELNNNNNILEKEKLLLEGELNLFDIKNEDLRNKISILENDIDREINAKESEKSTNHGLKQKLIDTNGKIDILEREIKKLNCDESDLNKEKTHLNNEVNDGTNELLKSEKIVDDLRQLNDISYDQLKIKTENLEEMKQITSKMALDFEAELIDLNKK